MANQIIIDIGAVANDGTGDPLRTAFNYVNNNFSNVWDTGLPTSNVAFDGNKIITVNTNGNLILAPNGTGKVVANVDVLPNIANTRNLGSLTRRWSTVYSQYLNVTGEVDFAGDVIVGGNLTVEGDTIQLGNITTDSKTIQLSNTAVTANAANGSGMTVGAADDIATILYDSGANRWDVNIGISAVGNIAAPYFIGNGSQLTGLVTVGGSNTQIQYNNNGVLAGDAGLTYNSANNTLLVSGNATSGEHAATIGASGFTELNANVVVQMTANANSYAQINFQNINSGTRATTDYIATAAFGTDSTYYVDMGIASNSYDPANVTNSLGNSLYPQDAYLYSVGANNYGGSGGNLVVGSNEPGGVVRIIADGSFVDNIVATFSNVGIDVKGNMIPVANGVYSLGNATNYWSNLWVANNTIYIGGVPLGISAGNVLTVGGEPLLSNDSNTSITTTGNITADYFIGNGSQLTGLPVPYSDSNVTTLLAAFGSNTISTTGNITGNFVAPGANGQIMYNDSGLIGGSAAFTFDENGNTLSIGTTGGTLKVADIQTPQAGVSLRLIPASGTTYSYGNLLPLFANTYDTGGASNRWQTVFANVANLVTASISGAVTASSITLSSTGTAVNASSGNMLTNQVTGTQFNFLNGLYTVNLNAGQATANYALRLPANAGTNGQTLTTDGTGNLSWSTPASTYGDSNVVTLMSAFGSNTISTTGNVTAGYFIGNGSQLTGLAATYGNANVATFLASYGSNTISTTGNITAGNLVGNISITGNVTGTSANVDLVAGSYTWTFDNTGYLTLPTIGGDEGGEINFGIPATNTTLIGPVKVDVYQDRIRFFDGSTKGAYIDLSQAASGVGSLLNNRVSAYVDAGTFVTMDNLKATVTSSAPRGLSLATVSGSFTADIGGNFNSIGAGNGGSAGQITITTTPSTSIFAWGFNNQGDTAYYIVNDNTNSRAYRITLQIGGSWLNNLISIERLI